MLTFSEFKRYEYYNNINQFRKILQDTILLSIAYSYMINDVGSTYPNFNRYLKRHLCQSKDIWISY